jgi:hypothetical protein
MTTLSPLSRGTGWEGKKLAELSKKSNIVLLVGDDNEMREVLE